MLLLFDISWSKLIPSQLLRISEVLKDEDAHPIRTLRNLNLSYNSLHFDETINSEEEPLASQQFIDNLIEYINTSTVLNHIDISGMNLGRDYHPEQFQYLHDIEHHTSDAPILPLAVALSQNDSLLGIHMSDNGLR